MRSSDLDGTLGQFLYEKLKTIPGDRVIETNGLTDERTTAFEILKLSCFVATGLKNLGLAPGDIVAMVGDSSTNATAVCIGAHFHGFCVFPISHFMKQLEFENLLKKITPKIFFSTLNAALVLRNALNNLEKNDIPVYILDGHIDDDVRRKWNFLPFADIVTPITLENFQCASVADPGNLVALIIRSSGTTGFPKGIAFTNRSVLHRIQVWGKIPFVKAGCPMLQISALAWTSGYGMLIYSIAFGLERIYITEMTQIGVLRAIEKYKPVTANIYFKFLAVLGVFPPAYLSKILQHEEFHKFDLSSLQKAVVGGSALPLATVRETQKKWPAISLHHGYGCTEVGGLATQLFGQSYKNSTGRIADHVVAKIIDPKTGEELDRNEEGEIICNSGECMMMGYWNDEESTKNTIDSNGFVHTGDIGYLDEKNHLYITGRIKEMFKVRGFYVLPQEVEEVITSLPGVADAAILEMPQEKVRALVEKTRNSTISEQEIINTVAEKLSEQTHLTDGVQFVEEIPRSANGKIRRMSLFKLVK